MLRFADVVGRGAKSETQTLASKSHTWLKQPGRPNLQGNCFHACIGRNGLLENGLLKEPKPHWGRFEVFNMFGADEHHKAGMMSVLTLRFDDIAPSCKVQFFKSHREGIADGTNNVTLSTCGAVRIILGLVANTSVNGIYNGGTSKARSFRDLIVAAYVAIGADPDRVCRHA
jgi:hypothetical protein